MNNNIVPFGKYKGQPIEVLQNDKQYLDWLQCQNWFKGKYQQLNTIIINNFNEPSESPEHNKLQAKFLDQSFLNTFWRVLKEKKFAPVFYKRTVSFCLVENCNRVGSFLLTPSLRPPLSLLGDCSPCYIPENLKPKKLIQSSFTYSCRIPDNTKIGVLFEVNGVDVVFNIPYHGNLNIELKPAISDDYPAVLRQAISNKCSFVITEKYTGTGATLRQVKDIFWTRRIAFVLLSEIEGN